MTHEERYFIYQSLKSNKSYSEIATILNRSRSTISREVNRNSIDGYYNYEIAQKQSIIRRKLARKHIRFTPEMKSRVIELLKRYFSPEQIYGRLKLEGIDIVSPEWIYQFIWKDKSTKGDLYSYLRIKNKRYQKRGNINDRRGIITNKTSIDERPEIVDKRETIGHWEADLVVGKGRTGYLVTATERKTNYNVIGYVTHKDTVSVSKELVRILRPYKQSVLSITTDNGKEFANHEYVANKLAIEYYFAHPYSSWERGTNENANGLIRQYFNKDEYLSNENYVKREIVRVENRLNHRPRKKNGYLTPYELYFNINFVATVS